MDGCVVRIRCSVSMGSMVQSSIVLNVSTVRFVQAEYIGKVKQGVSF